MTGTCYNFEMEEFFSSFLRRAGMPASAGLFCFIYNYYRKVHNYALSIGTKSMTLDDLEQLEVRIFEIWQILARWWSLTSAVI